MVFRRKFISTLAFCLFVQSTIPRVAALPAFPGAEGAGSETVGGRGGTVYRVTNLNDSGAGSLRAGLSAGNRTIIFDVSGTIDLQSPLVINRNNLTIAGQTAPGDGITLRRNLTSVQNCRDVIVRYIRFRPGDTNSNFQDDAFRVVNGTNIVIDHVSASWSVDETLSVTWSTNVTVQWSLIAESLKNSQHDKGSHGYGSLIRYGRGALTFHHNLYQAHDSRNPRLGDNIKLDFINNVIYNWGGRAGYSGDYATDIKDNPGGFTNYLNYEHNYLVAGPSTGPASEAFRGGTTNTHIFQHGNFIDSNKNAVHDGVNTGWSMFTSSYTQRGTRYPSTEINSDPAQVAYQRVLAFSGASKVRDEVDLRLLRNVRDRTGRIVDAVGPGNQPTDYVTHSINGASYVFVRGWPTLASAPAPLDSDSDGIPNYFELAMGWNPFAANNNHTNSDGYTDLEWYLNWLAAPHFAVAADQSGSINLRTLTGSNTNLTFSNVISTNGSAALSPDGFTVTFIPSEDFVGLTSFTFEGTNSTDKAALGTVQVAVLVTNTAPGIVQQPVGQTNHIGTTATFSVIAAGGSLAYHWQRNGTNLLNAGNVSGVTNKVLTLSNVSAADAASYRVIVTNHLGAITSSVVNLTILSNQSPELEPIDDKTIIAGATLTFTNVASDPDPEQLLSFTLLNGPGGATVGEENGVFDWRPAIAQGGTTNTMSIIVRDNGTPSLSATQSFSVAVFKPANPEMNASIDVDGGLNLSITGDVGPDYVIESSTNLVDWISVETNRPVVLPWTWSDPIDPDWPRRFYRVLLGP